MSGPCPLLQDVPVYAFSVVTNPQAKITLFVANLSFDVAGLRVMESGSQHLAADPGREVGIPDAAAGNQWTACPLVDGRDAQVS